jgi:hypothetical protein
MRLRATDGTPLWLGYGMNVHPGGTAVDTLAAIESTVLPLRKRLGVEGPFGLAVRWSAAGVEELRHDASLCARLAETLEAYDLVPFTGNAFVHGDFHDRPLKDEVYRPPWHDPARTAYTVAFAEVLAGLRTPGSRLSLSTAPGGWRAWPRRQDEAERSAAQLVACAEALRRIHEETGVRVTLGIEPEPRCTIETTAELRAFFAGPLARALAGRAALRPFLGACYDVCHQAVVHEDIDAALDALVRDGIPIAKIQASCALQLDDPADEEARAALARFDEPVYLHQVGAPDAAGRVHMAGDLPEVLGADAGAWRGRRPWRSHFHVPVFRTEAIPPLRTTRPQLDAVLARAAGGGLSEHLEIETYTWDVIPEAEREAGTGFDLVEALAREYEHVLGILRSP